MLAILKPVHGIGQKLPPCYSPAITGIVLQQIVQIVFMQNEFYRWYYRLCLYYIKFLLSFFLKIF